MENLSAYHASLVSSVKWWLEKTIIGHNFCPFARKEFINNTIHYEVVDESDRQEQLLAFSHELARLNNNPEVATTLILYPKGLESFFDYLDFLALANDLLAESGYEGVYQLASFHPDYCFEDCQQNDPANYTNRSPVPIIHLLREQQLEQTLLKYPEPELIPDNNIRLARDLGEPELKNLFQQASLIICE